MCWHTTNLNRGMNWYWGYLHSNGNIQVKSLNINFGADYECDHCSALEEQNEGYSFIQYLPPPVTAKDHSKARKDITNLIHKQLGTKRPDRFELLEYE